MNELNQIIVCGGGFSITDGINQGLWDKIKNKFVIGINFSFKFFNSTLTAFIDGSVFYNRYFEELQSIPLIIGLKKSSIKQPHPNTILLPTNKVPVCSMAGIFAMHLGVKLLGNGEMFLLGMDSGLYPIKQDDTRDKIKIDNKFYLAQDITNKTISHYCRRNIIRQGNKQLLAFTHFYQDKFTHKGCGRYHFYYDKKHTEKWYAPFRQQNEVKIYSVNDNPLMDTPFTKISYQQFFSMLDNNNYTQEELREWVKCQITKI